MLDNFTLRKAILLSVTLMLAALLFTAARQVPDLMAAKFSNPDSYYKLVLLRDYTPQAGLEYMARDNAPHGSYLHWSVVHSWSMLEISRGLQFLGLGKETALLWAGGSLTLLSMLLLTVFVVRTVANQGGRLAALVTALVLVTSRPLFAYGQLVQLTHHIFMLVPLAAAACCFLRERLDLSLGTHAAADFLGGGLIALALWISPETMPLVVALAAIRAALRLQTPQAGPVWPAALGLMVVLIAGWRVDPPPPTFTAWALDHISLAWLLLGLALASLLLLTDFLVSRKVRTSRAVAILTLAVIVEAACWLLAVPGARSGISALIPLELQPIWLDAINEMRSAKKPWEAVAWLFMPVLAGVLLLGVAWRERSLWQALLALTTLAYAAMAFQHIRSGAPAAVAAALSYGVALTRMCGFAALRPSAEMTGRQWPAILLVLAPPLQMVLWLGLAAWLINTRASGADVRADPDSKGVCTIAEIAPRLNALPAGIILAPLDATPEILWRTHQRTVAGNYHHNIGGLRDYYRIWNSEAPDTQAQAALVRRGVNYLLACLPEGDMAKTKSSSLMARVERGIDIPWLSHHETIGRWQLYYR